MRVESILGAFVIMLGNFVLHLALLYLSYQIVVPEQPFIDQINKEIDAQCVSEDELKDLLKYAQIVHAVAFCILFYQNIHRTIWKRCIKSCADRKSGNQSL